MLKIPIDPLLYYFFPLSFPLSPFVVSLPNICEFHGDEVMLLIDLPI